MGWPRNSSKKQTQFIQKTTYDDGDFIGLFSGGNNAKIEKSDFLASLGVTGTISGIGDPAGTAIYNQDGTDNQIRSLLAGSGIATSISPLGSVEVEHNFVSGTAGAPVLKSATAVQPIISSLIAGTGIGLASGTNSITITATGATTPTNTVVINEEADFPIQDATTITLSAKVKFVIGASFSTAKRFICEDGFVFTMENQFGDILTYTGTGDMFTGADVGGTIERIRLDSPNANQTFNFSDATNTKTLLVQSVSVVSTPKWGEISGYISHFTQFCDCLSAGGGLTVSGSGQLIVGATQFAIISSGPVFNQLDLGASVVPNIELDNLVFIAPAGSFQVSGVAANGNVPAGQVAMLSNSSVDGGAAHLENISPDDFRWAFASNSGIADTHPDGKLSFSGNALVTTISAIDTPVKVNSVWAVGAASHFTADSTGRVTYNGEKDLTVPILIPLTVLMDSGGDNQVTPYVAINGVIVADTGMQITASSTKADTATIVWQHAFQTGDYVELFVENNSGATDVVVQQSVMLVN